PIPAPTQPLRQLPRPAGSAHIPNADSLFGRSLPKSASGRPRSPDNPLNYCKIWETWDPKPHHYGSIPNLSEDQRRVRAPKSKGLRERRRAFPLFRALRDEINWRLHRRIVEIDGRRHHLVPNGKDGEDGF